MFTKTNPLPIEPDAEIAEHAADTLDSAARLGAMIAAYTAGNAHAATIGAPLASEHHAAIGVMALELVAEIRASVGELLALAKARPPAGA